MCMCEIHFLEQRYSTRMGTKKLRSNAPVAVCVILQVLAALAYLRLHGVFLSSLHLALKGAGLAEC